MNFFKSALILVALTFGVNQAVAVDELVYNWGPADTVAHHSVGPGMTYAKIVFPSKPLILWWVEVDLKNEYAKIEQAQSRHSVPDPLRWDVMTHYRENCRPGHQVKVAWNHDFFSYAESVCIGMNVSEGEVTWTPYGRSLLSVTDNGSAEVFCADLDSHITTPDNTVVGIDYYNSFNGGLYGDCILYNRFNSKQLVEDGKYISLVPMDPWIINGDAIRCRVEEISDKPIQTSADLYVLYLRNAKLNALDGHLSSGDIVTISQSFREPKWGVAPERILNAFHGYPSIVHDGKLHDGEYNNFENGREYEKSSRVMVGISQDKTKLYVTTTEMSGSSVGVDCIELAAWMVEKGAWDIVNFDSGGSAAIVIDEEMLNVPGRGSVRPVQDAMLAVSTAPEDGAVDHITFSRPYISPSIVSRTPLRVMSFNQYDEPICSDLEGCIFKCDPPELGFVDNDGIFHASSVETTGHIIAEKDGKTAMMTVCTRPLEGIKAVRNSIFIDNHRQVVIELEGVNNGLTQRVDPGAFNWTCEPEGIVEIDSDGVVRGIANGSATICGELDDVQLTMDVTVEISEKTISHTIFNNIDDIKFQKPSYVKNAVINYSELPFGWESGAVINFDLAANRYAQISFSPNLTFYSLPDAISMRLFDKTGAAQRVDMQFIDATGGHQSIVADISSGDNEYLFSFKDAEGAQFPYYLYPLRLNRIVLTLNTSAHPESSLAFESIKAIYPAGSGVEQICTNKEREFNVQVHGETLVANVGSSAYTSAQLAIYDVAGLCRYSTMVNVEPGNNMMNIDIKELPVGIYAAVLSGNSIPTSSAKFIVR